MSIKTIYPGATRTICRQSLSGIIALLTVLLCAFPRPAVADSEQKPLLRETSVNHRSATRKTLSQLSLYADLWHMAVIRGDDYSAIRYQQTLASIVRADIDATARRVRQNARKIALSGADTKTARNERKALAVRFTRSLDLLKSKVNLIGQFDRKQLSGNTSFLAGKYMDLLRGQMGLEKIWLAMITSTRQR